MKVKYNKFVIYFQKGIYSFHTFSSDENGTHTQKYSIMIKIIKLKFCLKIASSTLYYLYECFVKIVGNLHFLLDIFVTDFKNRHSVTIKCIFFKCLINVNYFLKCL